MTIEEFKSNMEFELQSFLRCLERVNFWAFTPFYSTLVYFLLMIEMRSAKWWWDLLAMIVQLGFIQFIKGKRDHWSHGATTHCQRYMKLVRDTFPDEYQSD